MATSPPCSGVTTDLLNLHKECLVRFDTVTLVQKRVDGKKVLFLTVEAPADDVKKKGSRRSPRRKETRGSGRKPAERGSG